VGSDSTGLGPYLEGLDFPASKQDVIGHVEQGGAPDEVIELLQRMDGERYGDAEAVEEAAARARP
jgi:Protein of unknown function (DUF2795)